MIENGKLVEEFIDRARRLDVEHLAEGLRYLQERDLRRILSEIKVPVHLLHGDCDRIIPVECARYMEKAIPEATLDEVHCGPHALLHTSPLKVAGLTRGLIDADFNSQ